MDVDSGKWVSRLKQNFLLVSRGLLDVNLLSHFKKKKSKVKLASSETELTQAEIT